MPEGPLTDEQVRLRHSPGDDGKEYWWALDATPAHSWAQYLYRYP